MKIKPVYSDEFSHFAQTWHKSEKQNDPKAQFELAKLYSASQNPAHAAKAFDLFKAIANSKKYTTVTADARFELGICYELGYGTKRSYAKAIYWYKRAEAYIAADLSNNPDPVGEAASARIRYYSETGMLDQMLADPSPDVIDCIIESAENGGLESQKFLMDAYSFGRGVDENNELSAYWTRKAVERGDAGAQYSLGCRYHSGNGVEQSEKLALYWWLKAAEQGSESSMIRLGEHCRTRRQYKQAAQWYRLYAEYSIRWRNQRLGWKTRANKHKEEKT